MEVRPWRVALAAVDEVGAKRGRGRNKNMSGIAVTLTDGDEEVFVARVAFARRNSRHPEADFAEQLEAEIEKAEQAADMLNEYLDERERQLEERFAEVQDRVREALGRPEKVPA